MSNLADYEARDDFGCPKCFSLLNGGPSHSHYYGLFSAHAEDGIYFEGFVAFPHEVTKVDSPLNNP